MVLFCTPTNQTQRSTHARCLPAPRTPLPGLSVCFLASISSCAPPIRPQPKLVAVQVYPLPESMVHLSPSPPWLYVAVLLLRDRGIVPTLCSFAHNLNRSWRCPDPDRLAAFLVSPRPRLIDCPDSLGSALQDSCPVSARTERRAFRTHPYTTACAPGSSATHLNAVQTCCVARFVLATRRGHT
jgi:hypothetical protein